MLHLFPQITVELHTLVVSKKYMSAQNYCSSRAIYNSITRSIRLQFSDNVNISLLLTFVCNQQFNVLFIIYGRCYRSLHFFVQIAYVPSHKTGAVLCFIVFLLFLLYNTDYKLKTVDRPADANPLDSSVERNKFELTVHLFLLLWISSKGSINYNLFCNTMTA